MIKSIATDNAVQGKNKIAFRYRGYKIHEKDGAVGFHKIEKRNLVDGKVNTTEYFLDEDFRGIPKRVTVRLNNKTLQETSYTYEVIRSKRSKRIRAKEVEGKSYDLDGSLLRSRKTSYADYDEFDQAGTIHETTMGANGKTFGKITESIYWNDRENWLISKPTRVSVTHSVTGSASIKRSTSFGYDPKTGALTSEVLEPDDELVLTSLFFYDEHGNRTKTILKSKTGEERESSIEYDEQGRVVRRINGLGHVENFRYDPLCKLPSHRTGPNGLTTRWKYDTLCRKIKEEQANGQTQEWFYQWSDGADLGIDYQELGVPLGDRSLYMVTVRHNAGAWSKTYYDAVGREVRSMRLGSNNKKVIVDKVYNPKGQLVGATMPYFEGKFPGDNTNWVINRYDALGRTVRQSKPSKKGPIVTEFQYNGLDVLEKGPQGFRKLTRKNAADWMVLIRENSASTIRYAYDAAGNLVESNSNGYIVRMGYDSMGNKIWMEDPSMGRWTYQYNAFRELIGQTDAKGQETNLTYDDLGRLKTRQEVGGSSEFVYDTAGNGIGKLAKERNGNMVRTFQYDEFGRPIQVNAEIAGKEFVTRYGYDQAGRVNRITHPDGITMKRNYSLDGRLNMVSVPKKDVWDYDYLQLEHSFRNVLKRINKLEGKADLYDKKAKEYSNKSALYREYVDTYRKQSKDLEAEAKKLEDSASKLERQASANRATASYYRSYSHYYWRKFGNTTLRLVRNYGFASYYKYERCTSRNWKGHCKRRKVYTAYIPNWKARGPSCSGEKSWKTLNCWSSPPRYLHFGRLYGQWADFYRNRAREKERQAGTNRGTAAQKRRGALSDRAKADEYSNQAKKYSKMAREQTDLLRKITDELEDQRGARDALKEAIAEKLSDETDVFLWRVTSRDAVGRLKGELFGNGLLTRREFDPYTGRIERTTTGSGANLIRDLRYMYDQRDNVLSRSDRLSGEYESFQYDGRDRIVGWSQLDREEKLLAQRSYAYDLRGNITSKSDAGEMVYDQGNRLVLRTDEQGREHSYTYDANGNQIFGEGRTLSWNSFNKAATIRQGNETVEFLYGPDRNRVLKTSSGRKVFYVNREYEYIEETDNEGKKRKRMRHHIFVGNEVVATYERSLVEETKQVDRIAFLHRDALGSVDTVTDSHGNIVLRRRFAPYGEELATETGQGEVFQKSELRGYTGHEQVDELKLINMNARIYDPLTARLLSSDPLIPEPDRAMAFNRYMYVLGNPMKYTDPDGHWVWFAVGAAVYVTAQTSDDENIYRTGSIVGMAMMGGSAAALWPMVPPSASLLAISAVKAISTKV